MQINKIWFRELPDELEGYVVVIDAWAASANMAVLLSKNPKHLIVVDEDNLETVRKSFPNSILIGESDKLGRDPFAWTNELADMVEGDVAGKDVLWMSVNGSRVFEETTKSAKVKEVLAGSLQNYSALVNHLKNADMVNIIMAGNHKRDDVEEDRIVAQMIEDLLLNKEIDIEKIKADFAAALRSYGYPEMAEHNLPYVMQTVDKYSIVPRCFKNEDGFLEIKSAI